MITHTPKKTVLTTVLSAVALVLTGMLVVLILLCLPYFDQSPQSADPTVSTAPDPTETALPTLPPPPRNPYGPLDFQYLDGKYLSLTNGEGRMGIDVSAHQGNIDWQAVAAAGVDFAMIRVAYRGYGSGELKQDKFAAQNLQGAIDAGLDVGVYLFSQAISTQEATEEAEFLLSIIKDYNITMPVVYDWEYVNDTARTANVNKRTVTECTKVFLSAVKEAGYQPMVYFSPYHIQNQIHLEELKDFDFWLALYSDRMRFPYAVDMWQYTCEGSVPGISTNVDINIQFPTT